MSLKHFAEWKPDTPDVGEDVIVAMGVVPHTEEDYGPFAALATFSTALDHICQGAQAFIDSSSNVRIFAGTSDKLYLFGGTVPADVSQSGGYSIGTTSTWKFSQVSTSLTDLIIAAGDPNTNIQSYDLNSSALFADLSAGAPRARAMALVYPSFLVVGNTWDGVDGFVSNRVWWPDANDVTNWPTPGSSSAQAVQSDFRDLVIGGAVQAITGPIGGNAAGMVISSTATHRIVYAGPPAVLDFFPISQSIGTNAPNSVISVLDFVFWWSNSGFYMSDGATLKPIGARKVDQYMATRVDNANLNRVVAGADPILKMVYWAVPDGSNSNGNPSFVIGYNWELGWWSLPLDATNVETIFPSYAVGQTLDDLTTTYGVLDNVPFALGSPVFLGGRPVLGGFDSTHKYGAFNGASVAASVYTGELMGDNSQRVIIQGIRPYVNCTQSAITAYGGYRDTPVAARSFTTGTSPNSSGICPQRRSARYMLVRVDIAAGANFTHAAGVEVIAKGEGLR